MFFSFYPAPLETERPPPGTLPPTQKHPRTYPPGYTGTTEEYIPPLPTNQAKKVGKLTLHDQQLCEVIKQNEFYARNNIDF